MTSLSLLTSINSNNQPARQPFSFHCTICYESYDPIKRPPVVLPCSHTYLCIECAKRLDKCMECRTPLTMKVTSSATTAAAAAASPVVDDFSWGAIRAARQQQQQRANGIMSRGVRAPPLRATPEAKPPTATMQSSTIPLPTPKNQVLLTLMSSVQHNITSAAATEDSTTSSANDNDDGYESGDDDDMVKQSMMWIGNKAGTYVVKNKQGLIVYDQMEKKRKVKGRWRQSSSIERQQIYHLQFSQQVQISTVCGNIASVAHGGGYIQIQSDQDLVKVAPPADEVTRMQGSRADVQFEISRLEEELEKLKQQDMDIAMKIGRHMQAVSWATPTPFGPEPQPEQLQERMELVQGAQQRRIKEKEIEEEKKAEDVQRLADAVMSAVADPGGLGSHSFDGRAHREMVEMDDKNSARSFSEYEKSSKELWKQHNEVDDVQSIFFCGADILPRMFGAKKVISHKQQPTIVQASSIIRPDNSLSFEDNTVTTLSDTSVDFTTGFSHHAGLNTAHRRKSNQKREVRHMGEHKGAARIGKTPVIRK